MALSIDGHRFLESSEKKILSLHIYSSYEVLSQLVKSSQDSNHLTNLKVNSKASSLTHLLVDRMFLFGKATTKET